MAGNTLQAGVQAHIFDAAELRRLVNEQPWEVDPEDDTREERRVYLGTVMSLYPSGKYYTPFACGNVTQEEADQDEAWRERAEQELQALGLSLMHGEHDPCDVFAVETRERDSEPVFDLLSALHEGRLHDALTALEHAVLGSEDGLDVPRGAEDFLRHVRGDEQG